MTAINSDASVDSRQTDVADDDPLSKVPQVTVAFWIVKIFATTLGETGGDALSMLNLSRIASSLVIAAIMTILIASTSLRKRGWRQVAIETQ